MKKISSTEERIAIVNGAMAAINSLTVLVEMEVADLQSKKVKLVDTTAAAAAPVKSGKKTADALPAAAGKQLKTAVQDTPLVQQIMALLDTPQGKATLQHKPDEKGFRPRNGRMDIIRAVVQKMGVNASTADLFEKVNEVSVARGLKPIQKTAFYTLVSEVRKQSV